MVPSLSRTNSPTSVRTSCPQLERRISPPGALRGWNGSQDSQATRCLQATVAWRDRSFTNSICARYSAAENSKNEKSYCFAPQLVQNEVPGASGTPQDRHFPVAIAGAGAGAGADVAGVY